MSEPDGLALAILSALKTNDDGAYIEWTELGSVTIDGRFDMMAVARAIINAIPKTPQPTVAPQP